MWSRVIDGRELTFRLVGLNNQNFLMRDEQTGSWWQQVTGAAVRGPLAGQRLRRIPSDEVRFAVWRAEHPDTRVLRHDETVANRYLKDDWEERLSDRPATPAAEARGGPLPPREVIIGITMGESSKAYPRERLAAEGAVADIVGGVPLVVVLDDDGRSARCFDRRVAGRTLELFRATESEGFALVDAETGSTWAFSGEATEGEMAGTRLTPIQTLTSYWFDWQNQHPDSDLYGPGLLPLPDDI